MKEKDRREKMSRVFRFMPLPEFLVMQSVKRLSTESPYADGRVNIREMGERMQISVSRLYRLVCMMQEKGYIVKKNNPEDPEGAYLLISEQGKSMLKAQEQALKQYGREIVKEYGKENVEQLLEMLRRLDEIAVRRAESMPEVSELMCPERVPEDEDIYYLIAEAQRITAEVSLDLREKKLDTWERKLLETEVKRLRSRLESLKPGQITGEEIREIRYEETQVERDAARLFQTGKDLSRRREGV
ncbi:MAG: MarR family winged helix-turn-helix transcriptional regulator [Lachnospiraceae bacterium]|nr:MarR family winged helix-turn-helix transcriptional regulator [Lachnospiraceae bacterium]